MPRACPGFPTPYIASTLLPSLLSSHLKLHLNYNLIVPKINKKN